MRLEHSRAWAGTVPRPQLVGSSRTRRSALVGPRDLWSTPLYALTKHLSQLSTSTSLEQLKLWMDGNEDEHLEFKEAKSNFQFDRLLEYCVALGNEKGGLLILGVSNAKPRRVVGTQAFGNLAGVKLGLTQQLRLRIDAEEVIHPQGRVLIFQVPSRPLGAPLSHAGKYLMRAGESLVPMTPDQLQAIFSEGVPDYSGEVCPKAGITDLDAVAIERLRTMWIAKSGNHKLEKATEEQLLRDSELLTDSGLTYAALILLGSPRSLGRLLPQAEVIYEYRATDHSTAYNQRKEYRHGFIAVLEDLWRDIKNRNTIQQFREELFVFDIPTLNESAVREAVLNALVHREYRYPGSIFIRQYPTRLEVISPGGFPPGITEQNILNRQYPRNRRIAEVVARCGLVERSGQGMDRIFESLIREGKRRPNFAGTDDHQVKLTLNGEIQDPDFLRFLEAVNQKREFSFSTSDLVVLDLVRNEEPIPEEMKLSLSRLGDDGIVEKVGRGRGVRYVLSKKFYSFVGRRGSYTRRRGLDRDTNKALLTKHIRENDGCRLQELRQVLPSLSQFQVQTLLRELKTGGQIHSVGTRNAGRWYSGPGQVPVQTSRKARKKNSNVTQRSTQ